MHYWISTKGRVRHLSELFEVGIWTEEEYRSLLDGEGLDVHYDSEGLMGRGLLVGVRPRQPPDSAVPPGAAVNRP